MIFRAINDSGSVFRYELEDWYTIPVMMEDGFTTHCFPAYKYYKNDNGEWEMCKNNNKVYMPIKTLMNNFIMVDSNVDKTITELRDFKCKVQEENLEKSLKPFVLGSAEESCYINSCIKAQNDGNN